MLYLISVLFSIASSRRGSVRETGNGLSRREGWGKRKRDEKKREKDACTASSVLSAGGKRMARAVARHHV